MCCVLELLSFQICIYGICIFWIFVYLSLRNIFFYFYLLFYLIYVYIYIHTRCSHGCYVIMFAGAAVALILGAVMDAM